MEDYVNNMFLHLAITADLSEYCPANIFFRFFFFNIKKLPFYFGFLMHQNIFQLFILICFFSLYFLSTYLQSAFSMANRFKEFKTSSKV